MSDDLDNETEDADDLGERTDNLARVVKDYLREGESFLVQCEENEIIVEEAPQSKLEHNHPRLYGRLLSLEEQLDPGCMLTLVLFGIGGIFCLGLHADWWDPWLNPNVTAHIKTWWFYAAFFVAIFFFGDWFSGLLARRVYRQDRGELLALMRDEGFDRDTLVPIIRDLPEFEKIASQLKLDRGPFQQEG